MPDKIVEKIINGTIDEYSFMKLAKEKRLLEVYEGKTIIDYILEYKRNTEKFDKVAIYNTEIAIKYLDYGLKPKVDTEEIFMAKFDDRKTFFEKYIENDFDAPFLNIISNLIIDGRTLKEILSCKIDNKYVFEHLEEKGLNLDVTYMVASSNMKMVLNLIEKGYNILKHMSKEILFGKIDGEIFFDIVIKKLLETGNITFICDINYDSFLLTYKSKYLENKMIIEYILDNFKEDFKKTSITSDILLYIFDEGMTLLEFLIKKYRNFVIEWSKDNILFTNIAIISILKANGIDTIKLNIIFDEDNSNKYIDSYLRKSFEEECYKEVSEEASAMIEEFHNLMNGDSYDKGIIELACGSFKRQFATGFKYAFRDLQTMIELVKKGYLYLKKGFESGFSKNYWFDRLIDTSISIRSYYTLSDFEHEMTHAIHWFSNSFKIPAFFERFSRLTSQQTEKIGSFIINFHTKLDTYEMQFTDTLNVNTQDLFLPYYTNFVSIVESSILEAQKETEIPLYCLSCKTLSESEFKMLFQEETKKEILSRVSWEEFDVEFALENIFDALSNGDFLTNGIEFNEESIKLKIGHGIEYFKTTHPFLEVIACYGQIIKSPRKEMGLAILKDVMGQEFIDMLDEFYANMYLKDLDYKIEGESYGL